jgi:putative membrane protein
MGLGFVVERFGRFLCMVSNQPLSTSQRGSSRWLGVGLLLIGAGVSVNSAMQFRTALSGLGEKEVPRGQWTHLGVWLNFVLAFVALALAVQIIASAG